MKQTRSLSEFSRLSEYIRLYPTCIIGFTYISADKCPAGNYADITCDECPIGSYTGSDGLWKSCIPCDAGLTTLEDDRSKCVGEYSRRFLIYKPLVIYIFILITLFKK